MIYKIKHENVLIVILLIFLFILLLMVSCCCVVQDMPAGMIGSLIAALVIFILFILEQTVRTVISVEDETVIVKKLFFKKQIAVSDIQDIRTERYTRMRKRFYKEQRMRMIITLSGGKKIVLNDTAMDSSGSAGILIPGSGERPDEDVTLFQAYQAIQSVRRA